MLVGLVVCVPLLPVFLVIIGLRRAGKEYEWMESFRFDTAIWEEGSWFEAPQSILHDPLTSSACRGRGARPLVDDFAMLGCCWAAFVRAAMRDILSTSLGSKSCFSGSKCWPF